MLLCLVGLAAPASAETPVPAEPAVPHVSARGQLDYQRYRAAAGPKAFAISVTGAWGWTFEAGSEAAAKGRALRLCHQTSSVDCALFAVGDAVVWARRLRDPDVPGAVPRDATGDLLPPVDRAGLGRYREYLNRPRHKAFAVSPTGVWDWWFGSWSRELAERTALERCNVRSPSPCRLFARDNEVVWQSEKTDFVTALGELPVNADTFTAEGLRTGSYMDRTTCEALLERVWVDIDDRGYCIRYFAIGATQSVGRAIAVLHGDVHGLRRVNGEEPYLDLPDGYGPMGEGVLRSDLERLSKSAKLKHPLFFIGRPGAFGSTGHHGQISGTPLEWRIVDAVLRALGVRYRVRDWLLAGQSGGSTVAAMLLGVRPDLSCVVLGSGGMGKRAPRVFSKPMALVRSLSRKAQRRIFVIGDPRDRQVPFSTQRSYHQALVDAGISAQLFELEANDPLHHGMRDQAVQIADWCGQGLSDRALRDRLALEPE